MKTGAGDLFLPLFCANDRGLHAAFVGLIKGELCTAPGTSSAPAHSNLSAGTTLRSAGPSTCKEIAKQNVVTAAL